MFSLILALNPSIDAEWRVDDVLWEEKNNVQSERRWAGGKGINVARWLKHLGGQPFLLLPLGGKTGDELLGYLQGEKIPAHIIPLREATRVNVIVSTRAGRQMRFNPLGPKLSPSEWAAILKSVERKVETLSIQMREREKLVAGFGRHQRAKVKNAALTPLLVLSGSLPRGVPVTAYAQIIRVAHRHGVRTLLDCDGPPFAAAVKARPFLVKPNEYELSQWWRKPLRSEKEILRAARALSAQTGGWVLVSRGPKRGLLVNGREAVVYVASPPRVKPRNTVGSGDALLAAVVRQIQRGESPAQWLNSGLQVGSAATLYAAGKLK